ncbi:PDZ domain-containing protein [Gracilibacillus sp. YIM 98692]|uniref:PDZ domain-containing protein n=1 Tax=Gracilibacillus sp. YIM 98692 TaxID=2663532 RepID=UPI0013D77341|nr:PDZ domain-containing protein [Gracilibacillus sp. YIM 98692]
MNWMIEFGLALLRLFMQPLFYLFFLLILLRGYLQIKKDRRNFGVKVHSYFHETKHTWSISFFIGFILSLLSVTLGFSTTLAFGVLLAIIVFLTSWLIRYTWLSASISFPLVFALIYLMPIYGQQYIPSQWQGLFSNLDLLLFVMLLAIFLLAEAWILSRFKVHDSYPELVESKRGKYQGQHRVKKLTMIPFFTLVPGGFIEPITDTWPILEIGGETYGLLILPYLVGFEYLFKSDVPKYNVKLLSSRLILLSVFVLLLAIVGYFYPIFLWAAIFVAFIGKVVIQGTFSNSQKRRTAFFQPGGEGLLVLGVLPHTAAVELGLEPGDRIVKVNDHHVQTQEEFYQEVQKNRAFCKLSIKDIHGELRLSQRALYEGEHHELGVLFIKDS